MNSLFDPDLTGVGHQPYGFDQLKVFFLNYLVTAMTVELQMVQQTYNGDTITVSLLPWYSASAPPTAQDYLNELGTNERLQLPAGQVKVFKRRYEIADVLGLTLSDFVSDPAYRTPVGSNPTLAPTFNLSYTCGSATQPTFTVDMTITYHSQFMDKVVQAQS